jgi:hypothetical protein
METTTFTPADHLDSAADLLEDNGWCRGSYSTGTGAKCAVGAIFKAADGLGEIQRQCFDLVAQDPLVKNGQEGRGLSAESEIVEFNDRKAKNKRQVVALFRRAARNYRKNNK